MRITRPIVLLALAVLLAPRIEASRTSVWERNPPSALTTTKTDAAGPLATLAPAGPLESTAASADLAEPPRFDLGDIVLVESELEHEDRFGLGPLELLGPTPLRGAPPSYPETRVGGFELLPPFRVGASPSLSLWGRRACGSISCGLASDSPEDPWGLMTKKEKEDFDRRQRKLIEMAADPCHQPGASCIGAGLSAAERQEFDDEQAAIAQNNREAYRWKLAFVDVPNTIPALAAPAVSVIAGRQVPAQSEALPARVQPDAHRAPVNPAPVPGYARFSDAAPLPQTLAIDAEVQAPPRGNKNANTRLGNARGTFLHQDQPGRLPEQFRARYPMTEVKITAPGKRGQDVQIVGGLHPSQYPESTWPLTVNWADFKPDTAGGRKTFKRDQATKWKEPTVMLPYDPDTGKLQ